MTTNSPLDVLRKVGLNSYESNAYLALLRLGNTTATRVATATDKDRATTYRILTSLVMKGLASCVVKNNVKYFAAASPKKIVEELRTTTSEVIDILPTLELLHRNRHEETSVELYTGAEGLKTLLRDILRDREPYTFIGEVERFFSELHGYGEQWLRQMEKNKIAGRVICSEESTFKVARTEKYRLIGRQHISDISTWTYGDKTALFIWSRPMYGVLIRSREVTKSNRQLFAFLWSISKTPTKKHLSRTKLKP